MFESSEATPPAFFTYIMYNITKKNPTFEGDESSSTSDNAEEYQTATSRKSFSSQHSMRSAEKTSMPTEAEPSATIGAYTTVLPIGPKTMPQSFSTSDDSAVNKSAILTRNTDNTVVRKQRATTATSLSSPRSVNSSRNPSERTDVERYTKRTDTTLPITSLGTKNQSLTIQETRTTSKHASLEAAKSYRSTVAGEHRTDTVTSSLSSLDRGKSSKNSELTNTEHPTTSRADATVTTTSAKSKEHQFLVHGPSAVRRSTTAELAGNTNTAVGRATVATRSVTTPPPIPVYIASVTNESASVKPSESVITSTIAGKYYTPSVAPQVPSSLSTHSTEDTSVPIEAEQPATMFLACPVPNTPTVVASTANSRQPSLVYRPDLSKSSTSLKQEEGTNTVTRRTETMLQSTFVASILTETTTLEPGVDTTLRAPNYGTAPQSFPVYTTATTYKTTELPKRTTRSEQTDTRILSVSSATTTKSKIHKADAISKTTSLGATKSTTAREHRTTTTTSLPPQHHARHTENSLRLARPEHSTTTTEAATITISSETISQLATITSRSTASNFYGRPRPSADADSYYADTVGTSQFVTPVTNATSITSDTKDTEEAATTTNATTVITRSKAMLHSYPISSARIGKKSTTLVKNTSTTTNTTITSTDFETTPKLSLAHSPTFTSKAWRANKSTDAETLISSTESVSRLRSYGDVYEKQSGKVTKAKSAVTSEMEAPAKIEEATPRHHGDVQCNLNIFSLYNLNDYLNGFGFNQTVDAGETIGIGCQSSGEHKNITLICGKTGLFDPDPSKLNCSSDIKTPMTTRELKSCEQCDAYGTESCEMKADGVVCHCYEHWSGKTCWRAADQCEITPLQCGKHGVCRSEVDYASCACDYGFTGEHCSVTKAKTTIISPHKSSGHLASEASVFVLTWYDIVILVIKAVLLIHSPSDGQDPQTHYQNCRSFVITVAGFLALFFRHPTLFSLSDIECQWVFYIITSCCSLGIAFFAMEAMNAYELYRLKQLNSWTTLFPEHQRSHALLAFRTSFPVVAIATAILVILTPNYKQAVTSWSCLGRFSYETMDLWSPIVLIQMCIALIASAFSYRGLFLRKNLPHLLQKVDAHLEKVPARRRNESKKCERDLIFTAIGPWLLLFYWLTLTLSNDFVAVHDTGFLAVTFAVLYGSCNFLQAVFTTPVEYSNFMWYVMRFFPASYAPKFDPVTMFSRDEVLEIFRQRKIDAEKGKISKVKGFLIWNSTYPDYLPIYARSKILKDWNHLYMNARNSGMTKMEACNAVYMQHVLEMDPDSSHGKQTRKLFLDWSVRIRRADPSPELVEHQLPKNKKLEQDFIEVLQNSFLPRGLKRRNTETRNSTEIADSHFPVCSVSSI
ncbi:hypothetical protein V3C99_009574, partial [Haemonchus contortus]